VGVALIQLELVSLFVLYLLMCDFFEVGLKTLSLVILFCVLASECYWALFFGNLQPASPTRARKV